MSPVPADAEAAVDWCSRAGAVADYREAFGLDGGAVDDDPIGVPPPREGDQTPGG